MDDYAEFRHLKYLLAIIEHKGVRAAAEALHITQPSLSRQAKEFQQHYKLNFYRKSKSGRIEITKTGQALPIIFRDLLEARDEAIAALEAIELGEAEVLRIGCSPFIDKEICKKASQLQKALVPTSRIQFANDNTAPLLDELLHDRLDAAIVSLPITDERLRVEVIKRERLVVCLPSDHPLAKEGGAKCIRSLSESDRLPPSCPASRSSRTTARIARRTRCVVRGTFSYLTSAGDAGGGQKRRGFCAHP